MKLHRILGIVLRNLYKFSHSFERVTDALWWPGIDILVWGLTGLYFAKQAGGGSNITAILLSGIIFWIIVYRGQYEVNVSFLDDIWARNFINLFVSPLNFIEWVVSFSIIAIFKVLVSFIFGSLLAYFLYGVNIMTYGIFIFIFVVLLFMTALSAGFFVSGLILRYGTRIQAMAWTLIGVVAPFSAIYYPLSILPNWAQTIAKLIPTSYIFEQMRSVLLQGQVDWNQLLLCFLLNIFYFIAGFLYLYFSFKDVLRQGLMKVF